MRVQQSAGVFALCVEDGGMEDLEARKVYQVLPDREASREGYVRVVDESGEDYMYPSDLFVPVKLPAAVVRRLKKRTILRELERRRQDGPRPLRRVRQTDHPPDLSPREVQDEHRLRSSSGLRVSIDAVVEHAELGEARHQVDQVDAAPVVALANLRLGNVVAACATRDGT